MIIKALNVKLEEIRDQIITWRRQFHRYPELGLECHKTAEIVANHLDQLGLDVQTGIARTGVVGLLRGKKPGPVVALRVDMDALPIHEQTGLPFASQLDGVMHACGHDGHTALGLGVTTVLMALRDSLPGSVKFIFQPGEESSSGAKTMITEGVLEDPRVDLVIGCHIYPLLPTGTIGVCSGTVTAGDHEFQISLTGVGGHAARPHQCKDPITAAGYLITALQTIVSRRINPIEPLVISLGQIQGGSGFNVIPDKVVIKGTLRYISASGKQIALQELEKILRGIAWEFDVKTTVEMAGEDPPLHITEDIAERVTKAAVELFGPHSVQRISQPSMGTEDFAFFSQKVPCAYFRLGSFDERRGYTHDLHTPYFDFDETILVQGTQFLAFLILKCLSGINKQENGYVT